MKKTITKLAVMFSLLVPVTGLAANVIADGREWRQVTETVNTSWNTLAASCSETTGTCAGTYAGWTWASIDDVTSLLSYYSGVPPVTTLSEADSVWGPAFFIDFNPTFEILDVELKILSGWTRDKNGIGDGVTPQIVDGSDSTWIDTFQMNTESIGTATPYLGAWMYAAPTAPIPEPEIYAMLGMGIGLLGWVGRRRKQLAA